MKSKHLTAALIFLVLTLILTNPLALHLWNAVEDKQDGLLNTWIMAWVGHALTTDPLNLFNANIFYPYPNTLAFSEILIPQSLFALPFTLAANNPIFGYNLALLALLWFDAFAMYLFVYDLTRRAEAAWLAGAIFAFNPFNLGNFAQLQLLTLGWLPLALLALRKLLFARASIAPRVSRWAFLFALFFILQALSSFYYALLTGLAVALYLAWWPFTQRAAWWGALRRIGVPLGAAFVIIALVLTPFLLPYFEVQRELGFSRRVAESEPFSASLKQFTEVAPENFLYGRFLAPNPVVKIGGYPLDNLFPGIVALALAACGLSLYTRAREKWFLVLLLVGAFLLALGPRLYVTHAQATDLVLPYRWLYEIFPPLRALRAPVRFDALINFALAALAGMGAAALWGKFANARRGAASRRWLVGAAALCVGLIALEYFSLPAARIVTLPVANEIPELHKWLARQPRGVILELPMMGPDANGELDISRQYFSTYHWNTTPDGYSGFVPPQRGEIAFEMQTFPSPRSLALARALELEKIISPTLDCPQPFGASGCVMELTPQPPAAPVLEKGLFAPSEVAAGAPFTAYLVLVNRGATPYAVKPTARVAAQAYWSDGSVKTLRFTLPLVTSSASVVPLELVAPARAGTFDLRVQTRDALLGATQVETTVRVGKESANEIVIPATVKLREPLIASVPRADIIPIALTWLPFNKINAYYSASVRLVNENGVKVANVDRQPAPPTMLWRPDVAMNDDFALLVPDDIAPGEYRVELLMYQAETDTDVLWLDEKFAPTRVMVLGVVTVK
ncbi:MAG: hypothetical protein BroJett039_07950 [Chloroflexota bacterium]|nr:MAG: hypothetical protein BroJett039_07950 [Chloroflexota bacterium]